MPIVAAGLACLAVLASPLSWATQATPAGRARAKQRATSQGTAKPGAQTLGRLGIVVEAVAIRSGPGPHRRVIASVRRGAYLALAGEEGSYYRVLMADRSTGWVPRAAVRPMTYEVVGPQGSADRPGGAQTAVLRAAYGLLGTPYRRAGGSQKGMDDAAFVRRCFGAAGVRLPRTARAQARRGVHVAAGQLRAADRLYFAGRRAGIAHTGIYIGSGYFIHCSPRLGGVAVGRLSEPAYARTYAGARR